MLVNFFYISLSFFLVLFNCKKKKVVVGLFLGCPAFVAGTHFQWVKNFESKRLKFCGKIDCDQMEPLHEEQYSHERNPRAYMSMRDYRNLPWKWQQPVERNPNPCRFMRDYRDQWMSAPVYSVPLTYAPPPHPQYASLSQPQPPQPISPVEQAILNLTKLVGDFVGEQKMINAHWNQRIDNMENSLNQKLDGLQSEMDKEIDNLHYSISRLAQQHDHQGEGNPERECLIDTVLGE